jgi:hypothetical protein
MLRVFVLGGMWMLTLLLRHHHLLSKLTLIEALQ